MADLDCATGHRAAAARMVGDPTLVARATRWKSARPPHHVAVLGRPARTVPDRLRCALDRCVLRARPRLRRYRLRFASGELLPRVGPRVGADGGEHAAPSRRRALRQFPRRGMVGRVAAGRRSQPVLSRRPGALCIAAATSSSRTRRTPTPISPTSWTCTATTAVRTRWWRCTWAGARPISNGTEPATRPPARGALDPRDIGVVPVRCAAPRLPDGRDRGQRRRGTAAPGIRIPARRACATCAGD